MRPGMRLSEALANCPELVLAEQDPAAAEEEWERILRRLEEAGLAVEPVEPGCAYFETEGCRAHGGRRQRRPSQRSRCDRPVLAAANRRRRPALRRSRGGERGSGGPRDRGRRRGGGALPRAASAASPTTQPGKARGARRARHQAAGPALPSARRSGPRPDGPRGGGGPSGSWAARTTIAWQRGARPPRSPKPSSFPSRSPTRSRSRLAFSALLDRLLAREERGGRLPRRLAVSARLVGGGSWRRTATLREPTAESERLRQSLAPKLKELPAPAVELRLELGELTESVGTQAELVRPRGSRLRGRLREGLRQVRAAMGMEAVCTVVEVAPWSRIPEARAILVPRDD